MLVDVILEIKTLKETLSTLDKTSDKYLELNNNYRYAGRSFLGC